MVVLALTHLVPLAAAVHVVAAGTSGVELVAWIVIPVSVFLFGALVAAGKGVIAFTRYLVSSQESQKSTADTNKSIDDKLTRYMDKNDRDMNEVKQDVALLKFTVNGPSRGSYKQQGKSDD